jgi:hypothetical protein
MDTLSSHDGFLEQVICEGGHRSEAPWTPAGAGAKKFPPRRSDGYKRKPEQKMRISPENKAVDR